MPELLFHYTMPDGLIGIVKDVSGALSNASHTVYIDFIARLVARGDSDSAGVLAEVDLRQGDGLCLGYHGWLEGDFGKHPVAVRRSDSE